MFYEYKIDGNDLSIEVPDSTIVIFGEEKCLSTSFSDLTSEQSWYDQGFNVIESEPFFNFKSTKSSLTNLIYQFCYEQGVKVNKDKFSLENYHKYFNTEQHLQIIKKTRELKPEDFAFDIDKFLTAARNYFKRDLNWTSSGQYDPKIITRINMPQSENFNPAHKDIYQVYDKTHKIPPMVNIWIPICGVGNGVGLPIAPGSHLINESKICRTKAGAFVNGSRYNVNCIKEWDSSNHLITICPSESQMLVFSSFLIHGLARNSHHDITRVSLEFRLFG